LPAQQVDQQGDRVEVRRLEASDALTPYLDWPGAAQVCWVERTTRQKGRVFRESRYAITSRRTEPDELLQRVRGHWAIENRLHWVRDVTLGEDACQVRRGSAPEVLAAPRNYATVCKLNGRSRAGEKTMVDSEKGRRDAADDRGQESQSDSAPLVPPRRPGRPRNASYDKTILDAALEILIEKGYSGFTIDGVAARTGIGRPTIYRRWPSKAALATAALDEAIPLTTTPDSGSLREDLRAFQRERLARMNQPATRAVVAGLVSDSVADPVLADAFLVWYGRRYAKVTAILQRAIDREELRPDVDVEFVNDLLLGPLFMKSVVRGQRLEPKLVDETVDVVLAAFGTSATRSPRSSASGRRRRATAGA